MLDFFNKKLKVIILLFLEKVLFLIRPNLVYFYLNFLAGFFRNP